MPNHFFALLAVGVAGALARGMRSPAWGWLQLSGMLMMGAACMRPTDSVALAAGLSLATLITVGSRGVQRLVPLALGTILGWLPWVYEAFTRFGGPVERYKAAAALASSFDINILRHLSVTSGQVIGTTSEIPIAGTIWWASLTGFSILALVHTKRGKSFDALILAITAGVVSAMPYFFLTRGKHEHLVAPTVVPRYLLAVYALVGIAAAAGTVHFIRVAWGSKRLRALTLGPLLLLIGLGIAWHLRTALRVEAELVMIREPTRLIGRTLRDLADGEPCVYAHRFRLRDIAFASDCRYVPFPLAAAEFEPALQELAKEPGRVFVVIRKGVDWYGALQSWQPTPVDGTAGWMVFKPPPRAALQKTDESSVLQ